MDVCLLWLLCVVRYRSQRRADHSSRGVLPTVVSPCVRSRNLVKMRSHTQSVVIEPNRRRITGSISYKPLIIDISVLIVCNKTGGTIKGDIKKIALEKNGVAFCYWAAVTVVDSICRPFQFNPCFNRCHVCIAGYVGLSLSSCLVTKTT